MLGQIAWSMRRNPGQQAVVNYVACHNGFTLADVVSYDVKHNEDNGEENRDGSSYNCNYLIGFNHYNMEWDALNAQLGGVAEQNADSNSILNAYKSLIKIRKENPVISRGKVVNRYTSGAVICYSVCDSEHEILVYVNASSGDAVCNYAVPAGAQNLYGNGMTAAGRVPAMSMQIYRVK